MVVLGVVLGRLGGRLGSFSVFLGVVLGISGSLLAVLDRLGRVLGALGGC